MSVRQRKGSALLVVLGMVAFIVISAVAFSAYMRYSRAPSSFLRQNIASRMLAKAALAEAIDEIDAAIGNNPHPGVGNSDSRWETSTGGNDTSADNNNRGNNLWVGRVFIGRDENGNDSFAKEADTVATLCYEALAYIPPALINEARFYSRHSNAAVWRSMDFDIGRYAYTAIDVSDFFDVNTLQANRARSSAPGGRITLAYLFDNGGAAEWDELIDQYRTRSADGEISFNGKIPLLSVADLNLAMGRSTYGTIRSPFCQYDHTSGSGSGFYGGIDIKDVAKMTFLTDGVMPGSGTAGQEGDLNDEQYQPFDVAELERDGVSARDVLAGSRPTRVMLLNKGFNALDLVALWDYLDPDSKPVSLAMPTVERNPMLVGLETVLPPTFAVKSQFKTDPEDTSAGADGDFTMEGDSRRKRLVTFKYWLTVEPQGAAQLNGLWMFPFLGERTGPSAATGSYSFDVAGRFGFAPAGAGCRVSSGRSCAFIVKGEEDFAQKTDLNSCVQDGVYKFQVTDQPLSFTDVKTVDQALDDRMVDFRSNGDPLQYIQARSSEPESGWLFTVGHWQYQKKVPDSDPPQWIDEEPDKSKWEIEKGSVQVNAALCPRAADLSSPLEMAAKLKNREEVEVVPYLSITARVRNGTGKGSTVDLVPAAASDDNAYNDVNQPLISIEKGDGNYPLMMLTDINDNKIVLSEAALMDGSKTYTVQFQPSKSHKTIFCPDPRWNFAPENFLLTAESIIQIKDAYKNDKSKVGLGVDGRDTDIFMDVSNQGWLQSPAELAYLPRTTTGLLGFNSRGGDPTYGEVVLRGSGFATSFADLANGDLMWRTYRLYDQLGADRDQLYNLGLYNSSSGFKVTPYTDSTNVMMAALANTPCSWWAAGLGNPDCYGYDKGKVESVQSFNSSYAFCEENSKASFLDDDLMDTAGNLMRNLRVADGNWTNRFENLAWDVDTEEDSVFPNGIELGGRPLYGIDRKMLFGFWRDCFDVKQQLFLIFIRAEPTMMGGGQNGVAPPQLGARAVALVWRDPKPSRSKTIPHQTRVLFYRQFD